MLPRNQMLLATLAMAILFCASVNGTRLPERRLQREYNDETRTVRGGSSSSSRNRRSRGLMSMGMSNSTSMDDDGLNFSNSTSRDSRKSRMSGKTGKSMMMSRSTSDDSTFGPSDTLAPSDNVKDGTDAPSSSSGDTTPSPTVAGATSAPTEATAAPTEAPSTTLADATPTGSPTNHVVVVPPPVDLPIDGVDGRTFAEVERANTGEVTEQVTDRSGNGCADNAIIYDVSVDVQIDFKGQSPSSCNGRWGQIRNAISNSLNNNFSSKVPDWNGDVGFGRANLDRSQTIDTRRRLGQPETEFEEGHRRLGACPVERDISCRKDRCLWFCLIAPTTSCGINSLTNWVRLEDNIKAGLNALNLGCLGSSNDLKINVIVDDPNVETETRSSGTNADFNIIGAGGMTSANLPATTGVDSRNGIATRALQVKSTLTIDFFGGMGRLPNTGEITSAKAAIVQFFKKQFIDNDAFGPVFQEFLMDNVTPAYDFSNPDQFALKYIATILISEGSSLSSTQASQLMAAAKFEEFIGNYLRSRGSEFKNTFKVHFRGVTPKNGR